MLYTIVLAYLWQFVGFTLIAMLGGMSNISPEVLDAAEVDGARGWKWFWHIILPMLSPTILFAAVVGVIGGLQIFDQPYVMTRGGPGDASRTVVMTLYEAAFKNQEIGYASSIAVILFIVIMIVTAVQFQWARSGSSTARHDSWRRPSVWTTLFHVGVTMATTTVSGAGHSAAHSKGSLGTYIRYNFGRWLLLLGLFLLSVIMVAPIVWTISTSLRTPAQSFSLPPKWLPTDWAWENYTALFDQNPILPRDPEQFHRDRRDRDRTTGYGFAGGLCVCPP